MPDVPGFGQRCMRSTGSERELCISVGIIGRSIRTNLTTSRHEQMPLLEGRFGAGFRVRCRPNPSSEIHRKCGAFPGLQRPGGCRPPTDVSKAHHGAPIAANRLPCDQWRCLFPDRLAGIRDPGLLPGGPLWRQRVLERAAPRAEDYEVEYIYTAPSLTLQQPSSKYS